MLYGILEISCGLRSTVIPWVTYQPTVDIDSVGRPVMRVPLAASYVQNHLNRFSKPWLGSGAQPPFCAFVFRNRFYMDDSERMDGQGVLEQPARLVVRGPSRPAPKGPRRSRLSLVTRLSRRASSRNSSKTARKFPAFQADLSGVKSRGVVVRARRG